LIKPIAFYLPQFHPIPENDEWWGKGFTEWTNVSKAKPLFLNHQQPFLPSELGYYDLRVSETREQQATLAREHGLYGFAYWHYWFGNGKLLLERPAEEVLASGKPDFPFCFAWANETWSGRWHGLADKILIEQQYPGLEDRKQHFNYCLRFFNDPRYIKVNEKPVFIIYRPELVPDELDMVNLWNLWAQEAGLDGIHFIGVSDNDACLAKGFAGRIQNAPLISHELKSKRKLFLDDTDMLYRLMVKLGLKQKVRYPEVYGYEDYVDSRISSNISPNEYPLVLPGWDNTPRSSHRGLVLQNTSPEAFKKYIEFACHSFSKTELEGNFLFIKSWNEWAEGNVMEPSVLFGRRYLDALQEVVGKYNHSVKKHEN